MKTFPLPSELSNGVISLDYFKDHSQFYFAQVSIRLKNGSEATFTSYDPRKGIDTSSFTKGQSYKLCPLFVWSSKGYFKVSGWMGKDKPSSTQDELWEDFQEKIDSFRKKIEEHSSKRIKAEREFRPFAQGQHKEALTAYKEALTAYKEALFLKKNDPDTLSNISSLESIAKRESQEAYESDSKYQKEFPNQQWFKDKGIDTLLAHSWEGTNRQHPRLTKNAGIIRLDSPTFDSGREVPVTAVEYRTPKSGGWQPFGALLHLGSMIGRSWLGNFEFRVDNNNSTIVRFEVPSLPPEFNEQKALEEVNSLLQKNAVEKARTAIQVVISQRQEGIDLRASIHQAIKDNQIIYNDVQLWEKVFLNDQDRDGSILPANFFKAVKEKIQPHGLDNQYRIIPWTIINQILALHKVNENAFERDFFDCDKYARSVWAHFPEAWRVNCVFLYLDKHKTMGKGHAHCLAAGIEENGRITAKVIEAETDVVEDRKLSPGGVLLV